MAQNSMRRPAQWMIAASCLRPSMSGPACARTPNGFHLQGFPSTEGVTGEIPMFDIKPHLGAPRLIFTQGYLLKSFPYGDTSARQREFQIRVFSLLGELPKAIEPRLPACQLCHWHLGPTKWSSPIAKSIDHIVITAIRVGFQEESLGPATCGFACNRSGPEAWATEASTYNAQFKQK